MIFTNGRIIYEHILSFLPVNEDVSFVAYHKQIDSFFTHKTRISTAESEINWLSNFSPDCVFQYETHNTFPLDLIIMTEVFNHLYHINELDIISLFEYTTRSDRIEFDYPLFDGERDCKKITEMVESLNE